MIEAFLSVYVLVIIVCIANIVRLHYFGKFMLRRIDLVHAERIAGNRNATYPAISRSYKNLKWYDIFNYKFDTIVVYEKTEEK